MVLQFRDINDWTPASISIVDKPSHPLAVFEVYENDDEFIKKYIDFNGDIMTENNNPAPVPGDNVTVSGGFLEKIFDKLVAKSEPVNEDDSLSKEILEKLNNIEENQKKTDERLDALENPVPTDPTPNPDEEGEGEESNAEDETTVELPLNDDGTLNLEDAAVAKYLPRNYTPSSQGVDPDLQRGTPSDKSFNERSGRDSNGMTW